MADEDASSQSQYPTIDPAVFDLVVYGTGLPESLLAAAAAVAGKTVLHLDSNPFYGSLFSSLPISSFPSLFEDSPLFSEIENLGSPPELSRGFLLDIHGPRVLFCGDPMVDLLIKSGASHHVEFKSVDGSLIFWDGRLCPVPDSRQAIFRDRSLGLAEKSQMMKFLNLVRSHIGLDGKERDDGSGNIAEEDLEIPFVEFLEKQRLPPKIKSIILYAITFADYDQDGGESCNKLIKTKEGIEIIALYSSSIGRFPNAMGAFIYPMYGQGELPQAFCRCAAVKGALYVLRMPVVSLLMDEENKLCKGVRLTSGQEILSSQLVMNPSFAVQNSELHMQSAPEGLNSSSLLGKVARGVCVTNCSVQLELSNILLIFPPRSLHSDQLASVRALQLSSNVSVCPQGYFVVYLSTLCDDAILGKECLHAAINALFRSSGSDTSTSSNNGDPEPKPTLLWSSVYIQEISQASCDAAICSCPTPDGNLDYRHILETTKKLYHSMYPDEEFFPESAASVNAEDDGALSN
ncbi:putative GDP dissociation inhibitor, FAD/NAD(P)-binding domain superfamily [Dioscorea sansibarensis]